MTAGTADSADAAEGAAAADAEATRLEAAPADTAGDDGQKEA